MKQKVKCICEQCNKSYEKDLTEVQRNLKLGRKSFCSIKCAITYRNLHSITQKELKARNLFKQNYTSLKGNSNPSHKRLDNYSIFKETYRRAKKHSKQRKTHNEFEITLEDLKLQWEKQNGRCALTNIKLILPVQGKEKISLTKQASLDRIDSSKGYVPGNIQFVCSCINLMKNNLSNLEIKRFLKEISSYTSTFVED